MAKFERKEQSPDGERVNRKSNESTERDTVKEVHGRKEAWSDPSAPKSMAKPQSISVDAKTLELAGQPTPHNLSDSFSALLPNQNDLVNHARLKKGEQAKKEGKEEKKKRTQLLLEAGYYRSANWGVLEEKERGRK